MALGFEELFTKKQPPIVGIDISSSAVKVLELSKSGDTARRAHAVAPCRRRRRGDAITEVEQVGEAASASSSVRHASEHGRWRFGGTCDTKKSRCQPMSDQDRHTPIEMEADH